jgi:hypothetical protein
MLIEVSNGELLDKLTILEIKLAEIKDEALEKGLYEALKLI